MNFTKDSVLRLQDVLVTELDERLTENETKLLGEWLIRLYVDLSPSRKSKNIKKE